MTEPQPLPTGLDTDPYWSSEAQETFLPGHRIYAIADLPNVKDGAEGVYLGRSKHGAFVSWDTPNGEGWRESVSFDAIRNLYR